ncbi:ATP-binding protein [Streptomyces axinellae]|uniref:ATP-binding protein n=1 Tax=Streptomyces axinellae TaxID=552788 RepID=UPI0031D183B1
MERNTEYELLRSHFSKCLEGNGAVIVVSGSVASGKTTLLHSFGEHAIGQGAAFLDATASRSEQDQPLSVIGQLLHSGTPSHDEAERHKRLLVHAVSTVEPPAFLPPPGRGGADVRARRELANIFFERAQSAPLIIGVDDAHYMDQHSLECLLFLIRRLRSSRILLVLNESSRVPQGYQWFQAEVSRQPFTRIMRMNPLSRRDVFRMIAATLGEAHADQYAGIWHHISGGSPLLMRALLEDQQAAALDPLLEAPPGPAFHQAVSNCLHRCGDAVLAVAQGLAVLADGDPTSAVEEILGESHATVAQCVDVLNSAGLLEGTGFRHKATRSAVLDTLSPGERSRLHADAARQLHTLGASAVAQARHLIAGDPVSEPWVTETLLEAADQAVDEGRVYLAADCLRLAQEGCTDERMLATVKAALVHVEWQLDPAVAGRYLPELTRAVWQDKLAVPAVLSVVSQLVWSGDIEQAKEVFDAVERGEIGTQLPEAGHEEALTLTHAWMCCAFPELLGRLSPAEGARPRNTTGMAALALSSVLKGEADGTLVTEAEEVLQRSRLDGRSLGPAAAALAALVLSGRLRTAAHWCDALLQEATERNAPMWRALLLATRAHVDMRWGMLDAAERSAQVALDIAPPGGWGVLLGLPLASLVSAMVAKGRCREAEKYLRVPVPAAMFQTPFGLDYLQARAQYFAAVGQTSAALGDLHRCGELMDKWHLELPALVPWRVRAAELSLEMGRVQESRDQAEEQLARLRPEEYRARGMALRVLAATSAPEQRLPLLRESAELLVKSGDCYEQARTMTALKRMCQELGWLEQARKLESRIAELSSKYGFVPPAEAPEREDPLTAPVAASLPPAPSLAPSHTDHELVRDLTEAELRVAVLAAQRHTNTQIAKTLFITVSTVEQHLTRVYRKLRVSNRADLSLELLLRSVDHP